MLVRSHLPVFEWVFSPGSLLSSHSSLNKVRLAGDAKLPTGVFF